MIFRCFVSNRKSGVLTSQQRHPKPFANILRDAHAKCSRKNRVSGCRFTALQAELQRERESTGGRAPVDNSELEGECTRLRSEVEGLRRALDDERVLHDQQLQDMR